MSGGGGKRHHSRDCSAGIKTARAIICQGCWGSGMIVPNSNLEHLAPDPDPLGTLTCEHYKASDDLDAFKAALVYVCGRMKSSQNQMHAQSAALQSAQAEVQLLRCTLKDATAQLEAGTAALQEQRGELQKMKEEVAKAKGQVTAIAQITLQCTTNLPAQK